MTEDGFPAASFLTSNERDGRFAIVENGNPRDILISTSDYAGVIKVAGMFQKDLFFVSGQKPELIVGEEHISKNIIIIGTAGKSKIID